MLRKNILITGGAGFIGSHMINYLLSKYNDYFLINLDLLTYAADLSRINKFENNQNYIFCHGSINDQDLLNNLFIKYNIDTVIHFAAETHVDNSIINPKIFFETNVLGTQTLLETARINWNMKPEYERNNCRFLHISTDEVYGSLGVSGYFSEDTAYAPNSPYSASKAASDFVARSYFRTYNLPVLITHCSNNYGPNQHDEKLIPTIIRGALVEKDIPIYGDGKNIRDWLYVIDHCRAIDLVLHKAVIGENYNIGSSNEKSNLEIAHNICGMLDKIKPALFSYNKKITFIKDRAGHDFRYAIDTKKISNNLKWRAIFPFNESLFTTIKWYVNKYCAK